MTRKVLIADNHPIFRQGLRQVIDEMEGYDVIAEAANGDSAIAQIEVTSPDIVTLDLNMPGRDGFQVAEWVQENAPDIRTIILSMHTGKPFLRPALECGASAFVAKEDASDELLAAFESDGSFFFLSSSVGSGEPPFAPNAGTHIDKLCMLTPGELKVLSALTDGEMSIRIAERFGVSVRTIHSHRNNICRKLGIQGTNGLISFAVGNRNAIISQERAPDQKR